MEQEILGEGIGCTEEDPAEGVSGGGVDSPKRMALLLMPVHYCNGIFMFNVRYICRYVG